MKKIYLLIIVITCCFSKFSFSQESGVVFKSSDTAIENTFKWAKATALFYVGKNTDPVGPWYEAALPTRSAFCMRDVSHQSLGGEILGLHAQNKNMFLLFAKNISENKDWCSYWEINKWGKPAPADYKNDKEFWYNLPANFDVITSLWKLYLWTGDRQYIEGNIFKNFYKKSLTEYIKRWTLLADSLLTRNPHPNTPVPFNREESFQINRGIPSYVEGVANMTMGVDLLAALYRSHLSYASILQLSGKQALAKSYRDKGKKYQDKIYENWMMPKDSIFYTYYSNEGKFGASQGEEFLLWFDALKDKRSRYNTLNNLLASDMNVESTSYMPLLLYQNGMWDKAYQKLLFLSSPETARRMYPEVSFGIIEGIVQGLMGVQADARSRTITTLYRTKNLTAATLLHIPILGTVIDVTHQNIKSSSITNKGKLSFIWKAMFTGNYHKANVAGKVLALKNTQDENGVTISYLEMKVAPGQKKNISVF
ncbi:hypothetical protein BH11BAC5_BH11BAC5_14140 [soil metagenome]